ncbi:MAG TPA: RHS repeat-associated core domain-containing protein [Bryobacteraceae bacterium]|nr:RHS repeat-associated core domain-containing protein [Bryobacteraceae bacterium]
MAEYGWAVSANSTEYLTADQLGSTRVITNTATPDVPFSRHDYYPFGDEILSTNAVRANVAGYGSDGGVTQKFTSKERDAETGLDWFDVRYMSSAQGRFTSPDPLGWVFWQGGDENDQKRFHAFISDPQNLNAYSYTRNNPLRLIDPTGLDPVSAQDCQRDPSCVSVKLNVILDKNAAIFDSNNNLLPQYQQQLDSEIAKAQDQFGNFNIHLDVTVTTGDTSTAHGQLTVTQGLDKSGINVLVTDSNQLGSTNISGISGISGGTALTILNAFNSTSDLLSHELAHHFAGDTAQTIERDSLDRRCCQRLLRYSQ